MEEIVRIPRTQYVVAVTRGRRTLYRYGKKLKEALGLVKPGESFWYAKQVTGDFVKATMRRSGKSYVYGD